MAHFAVVGATTWGVTLSWLFAMNGHSVSLVCRTSAEADAVGARRGLPRLPELTLPREVRPTAMAAKLENLSGIVLAVPAQAVRQAFAETRLARDLPILSTAKGIETGTAMLMSEVAVEAGWPSRLVAALSGPNLAHEIARGLPAAAVVGGEDACSQMWQVALNQNNFRVYRSDDITGVEVGGALKNVIAIAVGAASGLGAGMNATAALLTRGLAEMTRLGLALGADPGTFLGLSGIGDLVATCYSTLSRNRRFGEMLAAGTVADDALRAIGEAVEGVETARSAITLARRHAVEMPITAEVAALINGETTLSGAVTRLLARPPQSEGPQAG